MGPRLIAAIAAVVAALGVVAWGLAAPGHGQPQDVRNVSSAHQSAAARSTRARSTPAPSTPAPSPSSTLPSVAAGMRLVFNQTFDEPLNTSVWDTCYPWESSTGCTNFSNQEVEWYVPSQVQVSGGALHLVGQLEATEGTTKAGAPEQYPCRSGMITSYPGFQFEYGYVSIVAQIPTGPGNWPGLWMAASNFQWPPEIDILEAWGPPISVAGVFFHPVDGPQELIHLSAAKMASLSTGWHTFSLLWTPQELIWYVDGVPVMTVTAEVPHQEMYLLADLANFDGSGGCNGQLLIRSIDVWQSP